jgi:paraquat-inducible protein A
MVFLSDWCGCSSVANFEPRQFSLAGGIVHLFQEKEFFVGGLILLFSVIFPAVKIVALQLFIHRGRGNMAGALKVIEHLGKWSMLDVFVIAALVDCYKGYPGGTHIRLQWGIYVFAI